MSLRSGLVSVVAWTSWVHSFDVANLTNRRILLNDLDQAFRKRASIS